MTDHDDPELERLVRASLDTHSHEVDTAVPVGARARAGVRRRRAGRLAVGAAVVAAAAVAVTAVVVDRDGPTRAEDTPAVSQPATPGAIVPDGSRREYWHGVQVDVPAAWGWGTAPVRTGVGNDDNLYLCGGPGAMRTADGDQLVNPDDTVPYVGRPIMLSDLCVGGDTLEDPQAPYVWLGADLPPGISEVGNGYTQVTVEVAGTTVTVGSDDTDLRKQILASVQAQDLCPASAGPRRPRADGPDVAGGGELESFTLCAYTRPTADDPYALAYGRELDAPAYAAISEAVGAAPDDGPICKASGDLVVLAATFDDGSTQTWVVDLTCGSVTSDVHRSLTIDLLQALVDAGLRSSLPELVGQLP